MSVSSDACRPGPSLFEVKSVSLLPTFLASNSLTCCLLVTPRSVPPQSRMASSICGGFLPITRWLALYPLPLPWLDSQHRNPHQYLPTFELLGRLVALIFFPILACTLCLSISPRRIQRCHFQARFVTFCFLDQNLCAYAAPLVNNKNAGSAIGSQPRVSICISQCLSRLISKGYSTTRYSPVPQRTRFIAGKVLNTNELGERVTICPAGRFCASQAPQRCVAAPETSLRLDPSSCDTQTKVRFDG